MFIQAVRSLARMCLAYKGALRVNRAIVDWLGVLRKGILL